MHLPHIFGLDLISFIVGISVIVFIHEFGHYWVARRCGVKIEVFSIGFGPEIFGWNDKRGTRWKVACLPFGGYVKMFGDAGAASTPDSSVHTMNDEEKRVAFFHQHVDKRMAVVVAGPAANYLFAVVVFALLFVFQGQPYSAPNINSVVENGVAARAGLLPGDHVVAVDNAVVDRFEDIQRIISLNQGTPVPIQIERNGTAMDFTLTPDVVSIKDHFGGDHKVGRIGIMSDTKEYKKWPPLRAVKEAVVETWHLSYATLEAIGQMIVGTRGTEELGGVKSIAKVFSGAADDGFLTFVWVMAVMSVNLGLFNLFPLPPLDGGHLAFYLTERLCGRPLHYRLQSIAMNIGFVLVMSLMVFANWNDFSGQILSFIHRFTS